MMMMMMMIVGNAEIWLVIIETSDQHYKRIRYCFVCTRCCAICNVQYCVMQYCEILHCAVLSFFFVRNVIIYTLIRWICNA